MAFVLIHGKSSLESKFSSSPNFDEIKREWRGSGRWRRYRVDVFVMIEWRIMGEIKIDALPGTALPGGCCLLFFGNWDRGSDSGRILYKIEGITVQSNDYK